jgi:hypothetical protein
MLDLFFWAVSLIVVPAFYWVAFGLIKTALGDLYTHFSNKHEED